MLSRRGKAQCTISNVLVIWYISLRYSFFSFQEWATMSFKWVCPGIYSVIKLPPQSLVMRRFFIRRNSFLNLFFIITRLYPLILYPYMCSFHFLQVFFSLFRIARCVQSWTSPGSGTPRDTNCTATCPLSRNLFKLGEPDMQDIAGEAEMNS